MEDVNSSMSKRGKKNSYNHLHLYYEPQYQDLLPIWPQFTHVGNNQ